MTDLDPIGQTEEWTCGPASLRWVLRRLGKLYSEWEIARLAGTTEAGTDHGGLANAARALGLRAHHGMGGPLTDLPRERTIVGWDTSKNPLRDPIDDHYSVFMRATKHHVYLMDPWPVAEGQVRKLPRSEFIRRWHDRSGIRNKPFPRWYLTLDLP